MKYCTNCGAELKDEAKFCPKCGAQAVMHDNESGDDTGDKKSAVNLSKKTEPVSLNKNTGESTQAAQPDRTPEPPSQPDNYGEQKKKKSKLPIIIGIAAAAAVLVIVGAVSATAPQNDKPAVSAPTSSPVESARASSDGWAPAASKEAESDVPAAVVSAVPEETEQDVVNFTLTKEQATELMTDVAAPLLLTEWDSLMTYPDTYDPEDWQNLEHIEISEADDLMSNNGIDENTPYWTVFAHSLNDVDRFDHWGIDMDYSKSEVFGSDSVEQSYPDFWEYDIDLDAYKQYYMDAFGIDLPDILNTESTEDYEMGIKGNIFRVPGFEPYATIEMTQYPQGPAEVKDGKITFTGNFDGMIWEWGWEIPASGTIPWTITLDVVKNEDSRFGCNVTGYQVSAEDMDIAPYDANSLDGIWTDPDYINTFVIEGNTVTNYVGDGTPEGIFLEIWGTEQGVWGDDNTFLVEIARKGANSYLLKRISPDTIEATWISSDNDNITVDSTPEIWNRVDVDVPAEDLREVYDGWWASDDGSVSFFIKKGYVTFYTGFFYDEWDSQSGSFLSDGSLSVWVDFKGMWAENFVFKQLSADMLEVMLAAENDIVFDDPDKTVLYRINSVDTSISMQYQFDSNGFLIPDSSTRYLTADELQYMGKERLGFARNEIFARHGNIFETPKYRDWYSQFDWYNNLPKKADVGYPDLNDIEIANVELIKQFEAAAN